MIMAPHVVLLAVLSSVVSAIPTPSQVLYKLDEQRYHYVYSAHGLHLVDLWGTTDDLLEAVRFVPDQQNVYHLFTKQNPTVSQPLVLGAENLLRNSNFNPQRRTVVVVHGWMDSAASTGFAATIASAYLDAEDVNMILVDWSVGASAGYFTAIVNTVTSGQAVARFINWVNSLTSAAPSMYHIVGHSLGGHQAGIIGRNVNGDIAYISSLDPALPGWIFHEEKLRVTDATYTEVIHTNSGFQGYIATLGHSDFYPNGGVRMPGCDSSGCNHARCYYYFAESLGSGEFTGRRCLTYRDAMAGNCNLPGNLSMGGRHPKTGSTGIFYLETNADAPFSQG